VEVRTVKPKLNIDSFPITQARLACRPKSGHVLVASLNSIWCLKSTSVTSQMDLFVRKNHFELALGLSVSNLQIFVRYTACSNIYTGTSK
jgi:hypothetical protein